MQKISHSWDDTIVLNEKAINNIEWWEHCSLLLPAASIAEAQPNITLFTDASNSGWGGALAIYSPKVSGSWSEQESKHYINYKELKAIKLCILSFINNSKNKDCQNLVRQYCCSFLYEENGFQLSSNMYQLAFSIWKILLDKNICINIQISKYLCNTYSRC